MQDNVRVFLYDEEKGSETERDLCPFLRMRNIRLAKEDARLVWRLTDRTGGCHVIYPQTRTV